MRRCRGGGRWGGGATAVPTFAGFMELVFRSVAGLVLVAPLGFLGIALAAPLAKSGYGQYLLRILKENVF